MDHLVFLPFWGKSCKGSWYAAARLAGFLLPASIHAGFSGQNEAEMEA